MSVKIMAQVWDLDNEKIDREEKYVLLAYTDHADHEGNNMFPSINTICKKTGYSERSIQKITRSLEEKGYLIPDGHGKNGTNKWSFGGGANSAGVQNKAQGGAEPKVQGVQTSAPEPSLTIIKPPKKEKKGDVVDGLLFYGQKAIDQREDKVEELLAEIERGLHVNITRTTGNQAVAKRILKDGRPFGQWLTWCISDEWRAAHLYLYADLEKVWRDYPQAFENGNGYNPLGLDVGM